MNNLHYEYRESPLKMVGNRLKAFFFKKLTNNGCNLFLRSGDIISVYPQVTGLHEPILTNLIETFASGGYGDFLIDIGANIGLTSCQNGPSFKAVHMFEPNPLCCSILAVNATMALGPKNFTLHPFGLGESDTDVCLTVPRHNWGGAFIGDSSNAYDSNLLSQKDNLDGFSTRNYFNLDISIKNTSTQLANVFSIFLNNKLKNGVIKIDVEGYERVVLRGIAEALPKDFKVVIVFESWDRNFNIDEILSCFKGRATVSRLSREGPTKNNWPKFIRILLLMFKVKVVTKLVQVLPGNCIGDIVIHVN